MRAEARLGCVHVWCLAGGSSLYLGSIGRYQEPTRVFVISATCGATVDCRTSGASRCAFVEAGD